MSSATLIASIAVFLLSSPPVRLEPCPSSPNCVSSQAERDEQRMPPIAFSGNVEAARQRLLAVLAEEPRVEIVLEEPTQIHAVFTSRLLRFKDDVVLLLDADASLIHFRSASRVGRSDFGVNRERMERLSAAFERSEKSEGGES